MSGIRNAREPFKVSLLIFARENSLIVARCNRATRHVGSEKAIEDWYKDNVSPRQVVRQQALKAATAFFELAVSEPPLLYIPDRPPRVQKDEVYDSLKDLLSRKVLEKTRNQKRSEMRADKFVALTYQDSGSTKWCDVFSGLFSPSRAVTRVLYPLRECTRCWTTPYRAHTPL